tara:strand:- start:502 stop:1059 length:558 start_codon:yes stop_codon:yes gene_type:complete
MEELIDVLDDHGNKTGETVLKSIAHKQGIFHQTVHIWFYTKNHQILLQQRGKEKDTFPLLFDVSVAGHISAGESIEDAAIREIKEEIGITIAKDQLKKIGVFKSVQKHKATLIDCEFHHTFISELKIPLNKLTKQESEVADLKLTSLLKFSEETWGLANLKKYVPHSTEYYKTIIKAIKKELYVF